MVELLNCDARDFMANEPDNNYILVGLSVVGAKVSEVNEKLGNLAEYKRL